MNKSTCNIKRTSKSVRRQRHAYRPLIITALVIGGLMRLVSPVLADGTAAGTSISNTATATYEDPVTGTTIETTSNTVTVTVAEVAGITVVPQAVINNTTPGGQILPGNELFYDFEVTNVGNDLTSIRIPNQNQITLSGAATFGAPTAGVNEIQVSVNGGPFVNLSTLTNQTTGAINPGDTVVVRVPVTVRNDAPSGAAISVQLGDTGNNNNGAGTQNQPDDVAFGGDGPNNNEVRTVDPDLTTSPINGEREASAVQQVLVGAQPKAFAAILKSRTNYVPNLANNLTDDVLTYGLTLRVDGAAPAGSPGYIAAGLAGTTVSGIGNNRVLVSDAIPVGTVLQDSVGNGTGTPVITAPNGWQVVYSSTAINGANDTALTATWTTVAPTNPTEFANIRRVGFVYNAGTTPIAAGTTVTGFSFAVRTANYPAVANQTTIENIAQVMGETAGVPPGTGTLIYDESGDQNPSNFNDDGTPGANTPTNGIASSATQGSDPNSGDNNLNNDNQGIGPGGEVNVFVLLPLGAVLNGPEGQPAAVGPTDTNDDFTNQAVPGTDTPARGQTLANPVTVAFTNTVQNPGTTALTDLLLVPRNIAQVPSLATTDLPTGTEVQIVYGNQNATYRYNADGSFTFLGGTGPGPVRINSVPAGTSIDYVVNVTLPAGTPLSTDETAPNSGILNGGYPVPIVAFSDNGTVNGLPDPGESQNLTIDRTYLGYLSLSKDVRILDANGGLVEGFTTTPNPTNIVPGNILEYRIRYNNISEASVGSGNITLSANQLTITENGTTGGNNWALDNADADADPGNNEDGDPTTGIDTSNVQGAATATQGTIVFNTGGDRSGPDQATDVIEYINNAGVVDPQGNGVFRFRRRIN